jgi:glucosamine--fructose-6-phosphate aminotransferase (isomerizing)
MKATTLDRPVAKIDWELAQIERGGYDHFMLKEIFEQPQTLENTMRGRVVLEDGMSKLGGINISHDDLLAIDNVIITACGTSWHSALIGEMLIEDLARIPVEVEYASEFRYRNPIVTPNTLCIVISQSGETADTLAAMRLARERGLAPLSICNVQGSTVVRESDGVILTHAGPEIGVASTKAFVAQVIASYLFAVRLGRARGKLSVAQGRELLDELRRLRPRLEGLITEKTVERVRSIAVKHLKAKGFFFLGRGVNFPVALEGALKLKEISYVHAEGYAAGEMKHGPIALIEPGMPIVVINSPGRVADKVRSNIEQVKARGGHVISIGADEPSHALADESIPVPASSEWLSPLLNVVPLQLFAYHHALARGCDIDKPRNLAKSVTVE